MLSTLTYFAGVQRGEARERRREMNQKALVVRRYVTFARSKLPNLAERLVHLDKFEQAVARRHIYFETELSVLSSVELSTLAALAEAGASLDQTCSDAWEKMTGTMRSLHDEHERLRGLVGRATRVKDFENLEGYRRRLVAARQHLLDGLLTAEKYADVDSRSAIADLTRKDQ